MIDLARRASRPRGEVVAGGGGGAPGGGLLPLGREDRGASPRPTDWDVALLINAPRGLSVNRTPRHQASPYIPGPTD